jgi:hypothetical protein
MRSTPSCYLNIQPSAVLYNDVQNPNSRKGKILPKNIQFRHSSVIVPVGFSYVCTIPLGQDAGGWMNKRFLFPELDRKLSVRYRPSPFSGRATRPARGKRDCLSAHWTLHLTCLGTTE